jgi:hypothetical protein
VQQRKDERYEFDAKVFWTFFAQRTVKMPGHVTDISCSGCSLQTSQIIEYRRWIRLMIQDDSSNLFFTAIGRVIRSQALQGSKFKYGIQFTFPNYFSLAGTEIISALSKRNLIVRSCRNRNSKSPFRPEFLA